MKNAVCPESSIKLDGKDIELVDQYPYLGQIVNMGNNLGPEVSKRKRSAWIAFIEQKDIFHDKKATSSTKADLFNSVALPVLFYGCETWNTTLAEEGELATTQRAMERRIVGVSRLQHKSEVKDFVEEMYKRKATWAGHVARMKDNRWSRRIFLRCKVTEEKTHLKMLHFATLYKFSHKIRSEECAFLFVTYSFVTVCTHTL